MLSGSYHMQEHEDSSSDAESTTSNVHMARKVGLFTFLKHIKICKHIKSCKNMNKHRNRHVTWVHHFNTNVKRASVNWYTMKRKNNGSEADQ